MEIHRPPDSQAAYSIIELILVILIVAILAVYAITKFADKSSYQADTIAEQLVSTISLSQQLAMNDSSRVFTLVVSANQIDLQADGSSMNVAGFSFPQAISSDASISPATTLSFGSLGDTSATTFTVDAGATQQVCLESSGYAYLC